jgi:ribonuclease Z
MQKFSLKCFGTGDGWPSARNHSAFLYRIDETAILIDCGEPISRSFQGSGLDCDALDSVILSHLHFDHVGGFFMLIQGLWLQQRMKALPVYLPRDGIVPMRQMLDAGCIFDELLSFRMRFQPLSEREPIQIGRVRVTPFPTTHLEGFRRRFQKKYPQAFAAFCFLIQAGALRVGHSADIGAPEDLAPLLEEPVDLLVCELAHVNPVELFGFLKGLPIKHIVFVHLAQKQFEHIEELRSLAALQLAHVQVSFALDGDEIIF